MPLFADWLQRRNTLYAQLIAAKSAKDKGYTTIATIGTQLQRLQDETVGLSMSEADFRALPRRHGEVVQAVEAECDALEEQERFVEMRALAGKLTLLQSLDLTPAVEASGTAWMFRFVLQSSVKLNTASFLCFNPRSDAVPEQRRQRCAEGGRPARHRRAEPAR
jgi:hypothetical protein